jgi:hypothetical protein
MRNEMAFGNAEWANKTLQRYGSDHLVEEVERRSHVSVLFGTFLFYSRFNTMLQALLGLGLTQNRITVIRQQEPSEQADHYLLQNNSCLVHQHLHSLTYNPGQQFVQVLFGARPSQQSLVGRVQH